MTSMVIGEVVLDCNGRGWGMSEEEEVGVVGCISENMDGCRTIFIIFT
jgi:hypothetical protein